MDIKRLRYLNARHLLKTETDGVNDFAERIGRSQSLTSAYVGERPVKNIGDKIARLIEEAFHKERGWLDNRHGFAEPELKVTEQGFAEHLIGKNPPDRMRAIASDLIDAQRSFEALWQERSRIMRELHYVGSQFGRISTEFVVLGLEEQGLRFDYTYNYSGIDIDDTVWEPRASYQVGDRLPRGGQPFDLLFTDSDGHRFGVDVKRARISPRGWLRPVMSFPNLEDAPDVDPKVALFVQAGGDVCFFILPLAPLLAAGGRISFSDPSNISESSVRLGNDDITYMKNSFEIEYIRISQDERRKLYEQLREAFDKYTPNAFY